MDLSETNGEIVNENRVRRLSCRNKKEFEIESGGVTRTVKTKKIHWTNEYDNQRDRGCIENMNEKEKRVLGAKCMIKEYIGVVGVLIPLMISDIGVCMLVANAEKSGIDVCMLAANENEKVVDDCMMAANAKDVCTVAALEFEKVIDDCMMAVNAKEVCNVAALEFENGIAVCDVTANAKEVCKLAALMNESVKGAYKVTTPIEC